MRSAVWTGDWPITQPWGPTTLGVEPLNGLTHWHCGVDVGMPSNTPLSAARAGIVSRIGYGLLGIRSGPEWHYYIHIDHTVVQLGVAVATGQLVAYSGAKVPQGGYLTGPHLHFERNTAGLNVPPGIDPMPLLQPALYSSGSGALQDVTPEQDQKLDAILHAVQGGYLVDSSGHQVATALWANLTKRLDALTTAVAALRGSTGSVDLQPALEALAGIERALDDMRMVIDKIDRGD